MKKCVVIYNPNSGKLTKRNEIKKLYKVLENYGYETEIIYTEYRGHAREITKKLKDVDLLLCAGGDGTLNEVISGNIERKSPILLGHLPLGSVNDVAHMYGMSGNTIKNLVMLLNGVEKNIDVCLLNGNPFVYVACIGAFVDISYATPRKLKEKYGRIAYVMYGIKQLKQKLQRHNVKYTIDGETYEKSFSFIFITNSNRVGGMNIKDIYTDVKLDDNKFEVLMCDIKNKWDIIKAIHYLKKRELNDIPGFTYFKTDNIKIEFEEIPPSWCIDGDELTHESKSFEIKINKDNYMLLPSKNIDLLFEAKNEEESLEE
ncbi:MAG: diacylglycerol kinase family lipid kinase [Bacilli bacterium]|nr:diacylglycerol kinase family lipid kinase [Bacilli bacterium]